MQNIKINDPIKADYFLNQPYNVLEESYKKMGTTYEFDSRMTALINSGV